MSDAAPTDETLSAGVLAYVGYDREQASIPGRHPQRITDPAQRARVLALMAEVDAAIDVSAGRDLGVWHGIIVDSLRAQHPEISADAARAVAALITFEYR